MNSSLCLRPIMVTKLSQIPLRMTAVWGGISKLPLQELILAVLVSEKQVELNLMQCSAQQHFIEQQFLFLFIHTLRIIILAVKQVYLKLYFNI